ncbi:hypothetical protein FORC085_2275 [Bacillus cereus]|nr:hypothetical protein FORC085_2275 [Bacillus cereus]
MNKGKKQVSQLSFLVNFMNDKGSLVKI